METVPGRVLGALALSKPMQVSRNFAQNPPNLRQHYGRELPHKSDLLRHVLGVPRRLGLRPWNFRLGSMLLVRQADDQ
jgi:hypothetical protein